MNQLHPTEQGKAKEAAKLRRNEQDLHRETWEVKEMKVKTIHCERPITLHETCRGERDERHDQDVQVTKKSI